MSACTLSDLQYSCCCFVYVHYISHTRPCVYTIGSPINNRALFPCQEPPVAMSTWHATVQAALDIVVLMSGENCAIPNPSREGFYSWFYYVTMPMPASTFTIAVGCWEEVKENSSCNMKTSDLWTPLYISNESRLKEKNCKHMKYPCRFTLPEACSQAVIPHRIFASQVLSKQCSEVLLPLLSPCLEAAHAVLGTHPFPRLDILIVPSNFSSLGMASPHIIFLSQSVLYGNTQLCTTRLCHEIAHAWFGLAIGARDWTEEWISEGFATHLEDVFLAIVQKLPQEEARDQQELKALLCWRRLTDELKDSQEELQILRPHGENTGEVSESGASVVRHGLNAEKTFMQVHYLKGYFLLRFLANKIGQDAYFAFLRQFVNIFHGQLILSKDFLHMLLENDSELNRQHLSVQAIYEIWLDTPGMPQPLLEESQTWKGCRLVQQVNEEVLKWIRFNQKNKKGSSRKRPHIEEFDEKILPEQLILLLELLLEERTLFHRTLRCLENTYRLRNQDAEVRHRWCELVVKHKYTVAYKDIEKFLHEDQAMGVYLYGELMVNEDARQQEIAHRCFAAVRDDMDVSCVKVIGEMLF
ncbi:aminopeptidase O-like [Xenopus laevis]|uniref:Aminopeptidase O-like n=1 Tax=Xenopus laevis TaxID=8355 RepID=A0A8J1KT13_XENLA|nr:aminopeptidase O-like [Xenopus laevis]